MVKSVRRLELGQKYAGNNNSEKIVTNSEFNFSQISRP